MQARRSWSAIVVGVIVMLIGVVLALGGAWRAARGGSIYYLVTGIAMLASGILLFRQRMAGGWLYLATVVLTILWAFYEVGGDSAWALGPRIAAPLVLLVAVLLVMPTLTAAPRRWHNAWGGVIGAFLLGVIIFGVTGRDDTAIAALPSPSAPGMADPSGQATGRDWPAYGGTYAARRYSPLTQINAGNVGKLEQVWETHTGGMPREARYQELYGTENTPLKIGNLLYTCTAKNIIVALAAATGKQEWRIDPKVPDVWIPYTTACRGVDYYAVPGAAANAPCARRIIMGTLDSRLIAVDALAGPPCPGFGTNGQADTKIGMGKVFPGLASINSAPTIVRGVVVVGHQILDGQYKDAPSGVVEGFDAVTGKLRWAWDVMHPDWNDYLSAHRTPQENQFSSSLVALDVTTGKPRWRFQAVAKDVWDYDFGSQATLIDYKGKAALLVPSKQGDLYILDRATGRPLPPVGRINAPQGGAEPGP